MVEEDKGESIHQDTFSNGHEGVSARRKSTWRLSSQKRRQVMQTIVLYIGFFSQGMSSSVVGPTLLDLGRITNNSFQSVSLLFISSYVASLAGASLAGFLMPRLHHWLILALIMFLLGVENILVPYMWNLPLLCTAFALNGMAAAMNSTGSNMVLLKIWGKESGPWMQALHCIFGFGALTGPLVAEPFLRARTPKAVAPTAFSPVTAPLLHNASSIFHQNQSDAHQILFNSSHVSVLLAQDDGATKNPFDSAFNQTQNITLQTAEPYMTGITWAYLIVGISCLLSSLLLMIIVFSCSEIKLSCLKKLKEKPNQKKKDDPKKERDKKIILTLIVLLFFFYMVYSILEMNIGNYLMAYAVKELDWSEKEGAQVTSGYWGMLTVGRALGIVLVNFINPSIIITGQIVITVFSLGSLMLFSHYHKLVLWISTLMLGFGISTIFGMGIIWAELYINVSEGAAAVFIIAVAVGRMIGPAIIGILFERVGPQVFVYFMFSVACLLVLVYVIMNLVARKLRKRYSDQVPKKGAELQGNKPLDDQHMSYCTC